MVSVIDNGAGLRSDQLEAIFERFRSVPGGTGIGLTIARSIARMHSGEGDVTPSSPGLGHGSIFSVELPLHQRAASIEADKDRGA